MGDGMRPGTKTKVELVKNPTFGYAKNGAPGGTVFDHFWERGGQRLTVQMRERNVLAKFVTSIS